MDNMRLERELDAIGEKLMALASKTPVMPEEQPAAFRVGMLLVSRSSGRRCRVIGISASEVCVEYSDYRVNWYDVDRVDRLYTAV